MAQDPYEVLGVTRTASADDIKRAYRTLARKHHPDLNPGDTQAEARFKAANTAHALLSDPEKRARYDRGEIDADEQERRPGPPPGAGFSEDGWRTYAEADQGSRYRWHGGANDFDASSFEDLFGDYARRANGTYRGRDAHYVLNVRFLDTVLGASRRLTLPEGHTLDVRIPPGIETGQVLRLKERGAQGHNGGPAGDALIEIIVSPDEIYTRSGNDIQLELPVTAREVLLGERITIPTPHGNVAMKLPSDADTGRIMRLRGKGIAPHGQTPAGDLLVTLKVMIGPRDEKLVTALQDWTPPSDAPDPRASLWSAHARSGENA